MLTQSASQPRLWRVIQGASQALIQAPSYDEAKARAAAIGFKDPDSIVLQDGKS